MLDHWTTNFICAPEISLQISCWSSAYSSRYCDSKISLIWFKMPTQTPQNHVFVEFLPPNVIFYQRDPQKALPYAETRVLSHKRSWSVLWCDLDARGRIQKKTKVSQNSSFSQTPFSSSPVNQILHVGSYPGFYLSWFQVLLRSVAKCGAVGSRNFIDLAHHL